MCATHHAPSPPAYETTAGHGAGSPPPPNRAERDHDPDNDRPHARTRRDRHAERNRRSPQGRLRHRRRPAFGRAGGGISWVPGLDTLLRDLGVTQVALTGLSTSSGVESTARSASDHGYHVVLATDAITDPDVEAHRHSVGVVFPKLGETATTDEILDMLQRRGDPARPAPEKPHR